MKNARLALGLAALVVCGVAFADINVGVTLSATGPAASLGIPEKNTIDMLGSPTIAGQKVHFIVLDDKSDTTEAVKNTRKLISEDKVDVVIGSTVTPNSLAMRDVVNEAEVPMISMAASAQIVNPADPRTKWVFKTPQNDSLMADAIAVHMRANGVHTVGFIGFADAYGDSWLAEMRRSTQTAGIRIVAEEKYNRNDPSVTGQVLKILAAHPDAVLIAGSGTPAATPHKELVARGYKGRIYQTHGVANADFLRVVGADGERCGAAGRADAGLRAVAGQQRGEEIRGRVRECLRGQVRPRQPHDVRRPRLGRVRAAAAGDTRSAEDGPAGHPGVSRGATRCARKRQGRRWRQWNFQHERRGSQRHGQPRARHRQD